MILFFTKEEMGGSCNRQTYMDALENFETYTGRVPRIAWLSVECMHDMDKWARVAYETELLSVEDLQDRVNEHTGVVPGFKIMVSVKLDAKDGMYFGVGD